MTNKEIKKELEKIYKEIDEWSQLNRVIKSPLLDNEVRKRELTLWKQQLLYCIEDASKQRDRKKKDFSIELYNVINRYLERMNNYKNK